MAKYIKSWRQTYGCNLNCFLGCQHNWSLVDVDEDKDPVGKGEGDIDDGDEVEAEVLDLLLGLPLPHAVHQLSQLVKNVLFEAFESKITVHSQMRKKVGRTQKNAQTSK